MKKIEILVDRCNEFAEENPTGFVAAVWAVTMCACIPLAWASYKLQGWFTAKEVVKQLAKK